MKIYKGNTKNTAVINAAKAADLSRIIIAVFRSAFRSSVDCTLEIFPNLSKLNVPANPYAKQNLLLDCTNPIEKTSAGTKIESREDLVWSVAKSAVAEETVRNIPKRATN